MKYRYTTKELTEIFFEALGLFNECLESDISESNTVIAFFTPDNGIAVYEKFCKEHFPKNLSENYKAEGYMDSFAAQAFVSVKEYGVLIREDIDFTLAELQYTLLHEISHMFCTRNEVENGCFFDRYCMGSGEEDGIINAGYAIWREAIADIMADSVLSENATMTLNQVKTEVLKLFDQVGFENPDSKKCVSLILAYIMISREVACTYEWQEAEKEIENQISFSNSIMMLLLEMSFVKMKESPFWEITPDFIIDLGSTYIAMLASKRLQSM